MEKQTVFIKRYPSKGELPEFKDGVYQGYFHTEFGIVKYSKYDGWKLSRKYPDYFLEEIELPSMDDIMEFKVLKDKPTNIDLQRLRGFKSGANFILNHLKSNTNETDKIQRN